MLVRRIDAAREVFAPAKLNLYLDVLGRRDDGFHELETLMAPIRLYDRLLWEPVDSDRSQRLTLEYDPSTPAALQAAAPLDKRNLVWRALRLLGEEAGVEPYGRVIVTKRIPVQAGLGGGSSDAAAALLLANDAWDLGYSRNRLAELGGRLGSDVPFFLSTGSAVCRGRGELVQPIAALPRLDVVVVKPPVGIATTEAFQSLAAREVTATRRQESSGRLQSLVDRLQAGSIASAGAWMTNALQVAAGRLSDWIDRLQFAFSRLGCLAYLMTGSGSAFFGVMRSARQVRLAVGSLSSQSLGAVFASATIR